ncbi:MAG: hypothetical protein WCO78_02920 [Candidatus Roizmanbacteria bacterium]
MENINRGLTALFIIIFAFAVAFFIFYRLGFFTRFFPNSKLTLPAIFSGKTINLTPTPTGVQEASPTPTGTVVPTTSAATRAPSKTLSTGNSPTSYPTPIRATPTRTVRGFSTPITSIPNTGSATIILPLLGSLGGLGMILRKKSK